MSVSVVNEVDFTSLVTDLDNLCKEIVAAKRPVYTNGNGDSLRNFRLNAALANSTLGQQLGFGLVKQITAIVDILNNPNTTDEERDRRFADARNYIDMAYVAYKKGQLYEKYL